jgi:hypothetical protein
VGIFGNKKRNRLLPVGMVVHHEERLVGRPHVPEGNPGVIAACREEVGLVRVEVQIPGVSSTEALYYTTERVKRVPNDNDRVSSACELHIAIIPGMLFKVGEGSSLLPEADFVRLLDRVPNFPRTQIPYPQRRLETHGHHGAVLVGPPFAAGWGVTQRGLVLGRCQLNVHTLLSIKHNAGLIENGEQESR